jgi:hypothetical protein
LILNGDMFQPHLKYTLKFFATCTSRLRSFITILVHSSVYHVYDLLLQYYFTQVYILFLF